jgi:hypothetical protein
MIIEKDCSECSALTVADSAPWTVHKPFFDFALGASNPETSKHRMEDMNNTIHMNLMMRVILAIHRTLYRGEKFGPVSFCL